MGKVIYWLLGPKSGVLIFNEELVKLERALAPMMALIFHQDPSRRPSANDPITHANKAILSLQAESRGAPLRMQRLSILSLAKVNELIMALDPNDVDEEGHHKDPSAAVLLYSWNNPITSRLFKHLGYLAAYKVIVYGEPPAEMDTVQKLDAEFDRRELEYRWMFVLDRNNAVIDKNPYVYLENLFPGKLSIPYIKQPLATEEQQYTFVCKMAMEKAGDKVMVSSLAEFKTTGTGSLWHVNFNNVFIAGGSILAALQPSVKGAEKGGFFNSDIDVLLYGLTVDQVRVKVIQICEAIMRVVSGNPDFVAERSLDKKEPSWSSTRTPLTDKNMIIVKNLRSLIFIGEYPRRQIQIVFRTFPITSRNPNGVAISLCFPNILLPFLTVTHAFRFDIDSCCFGFDGHNVYALPRAIRAVTRRYSLVDMTRRSASYEYRLFKYSKGHFAVAIPPDVVNPSKVFFNRITEGDGLARLITLEQQVLLPKYHYKKSKKPAAWDRAEIIQADRIVEELEVADQDQSHYQIVKIPYGENWPLNRLLKFLAWFQGKYLSI
ncbi:Protein mono-ADP-ribosyltransferase parp4 [Phlyctochytrium planicorne]|nr:Protein mono-ADP-ribosyltransferase parp4 [Phlyctochytrium planicorne]